jgi:hypothetical protein
LRSDLARALTAGFLAGEWSPAGLLESAAAVVGEPRWLPRLRREVLSVYEHRPADRPRELQSLILFLLDRAGATP